MENGADMYKVTVIVPVYNAENYICECIDSILGQTLDQIELIVIDDGSTDRTGTILDEKYGNRENVRIFHQPNKGLFATRRIGLSKARGEYVGWVDADDYISPEMYETLYNRAAEDHSDLVICDYEWFPDKPKTKEKWFREYKGVRDVTFVERNSQPWNKIVKRELLEKLHIGDGFEACFDEIYIKALIAAENPSTVDRKMYFYRVGGGSMSSSYKNTSHYLKFIRSSENLRSEMEPLIRESDYWKSYFDYRIDYYRLMTLIVAANAADRKTYQEIRKELKEHKPSYTNNMHFSSIMKENFGALKTFVIGRLIPLCYPAARMICLAVMR